MNRCPDTSELVSPRVAPYCQPTAHRDLADGLRVAFYDMLGHGWTVESMVAAIRAFLQFLRERGTTQDQVTSGLNAFPERVMVVHRPMAETVIGNLTGDTVAGPRTVEIPPALEEAISRYVDPEGARRNLLLLAYLILDKKAKLRPRKGINLPKDPNVAMVNLMYEWGRVAEMARSYQGEVLDTCLLRDFFVVRSTSMAAAEEARAWYESLQKL